MAIVADHYDFLLGVDTHAASHTLALITASTGAVHHQQAPFPTSPAGLRRATAWIQRHTQDTTTLVVIDGAGSYAATFTEQLTAAGYTVTEAPDVPAISRRRHGKSDALDAIAMAQATRGLNINELRWPRATGPRTALRVLTIAREQMSGERTRTVNALTALLRHCPPWHRRPPRPDHHDHHHHRGLAHPRRDPTPCRLPSRGRPPGPTHPRPRRRTRRQPHRPARSRHHASAATARPARRRRRRRRNRPAGLVTSRTHPLRGRVRRPGRRSPLPASSGNTTRHRLNRGGDRRLDRALYTVALVRMGADPAPAPTSPAAPPKAAPNARSCATSSATSAGRSSGPWPPPTRRNHPLTAMSISVRSPGAPTGRRAVRNRDVPLRRTRTDAQCGELHLNRTTHHGSTIPASDLSSNPSSSSICNATAACQRRKSGHGDASSDEAVRALPECQCQEEKQLPFGIASMLAHP